MRVDPRTHRGLAARRPALRLLPRRDLPRAAWTARRARFAGAPETPVVGAHQHRARWARARWRPTGDGGFVMAPGSRALRARRSSGAATPTGVETVIESDGRADAPVTARGDLDAGTRRAVRPGSAAGGRQVLRRGRPGRRRRRPRAAPAPPGGAGASSPSRPAAARLGRPGRARRVLLVCPTATRRRVGRRPARGRRCACGPRRGLVVVAVPRAGRGVAVARVDAAGAPRAGARRGAGSRVPARRRRRRRVAIADGAARAGSRRGAAAARATAARRAVDAVGADGAGSPGSSAARAGRARGSASCGWEGADEAPRRCSRRCWPCCAASARPRPRRSSSLQDDNLVNVRGPGARGRASTPWPRPASKVTRVDVLWRAGGAHAGRPTRATRPTRPTTGAATTRSCAAWRRAGSRSMLDFYLTPAWASRSGRRRRRSAAGRRRALRRRPRAALLGGLPRPGRRRRCPRCAASRSGTSPTSPASGCPSAGAARAARPCWSRRACYAALLAASYREIKAANPRAEVDRRRRRARRALADELPQGRPARPSEASTSPAWVADEGPPIDAWSLHLYPHRLAAPGLLRALVEHAAPGHPAGG